MHLSPRQAEIVGLIAAGRSDKEIAGQLGMSPRTVRTHLERIYLQHGFKSRAAAVSEWLKQQHATRSARPGDECPYARPFPEGFNECPAYQSMQLLTLDLSDRPLTRTNTCRHLETKRMPYAEGRWYGGCQVGNQAARGRWAAGVGADRLQKIAVLRQDLRELTGPFVQSLWAHKSQQLREMHAGRDVSGPLARMQALAEQFMASTRAFLLQRQAVLDDVGLPLDAVMDLIRFSIERFTIGSPDASWQVPESILERFPLAARIFLMPRSAEQRAEPMLASTA